MPTWEHALGFYDIDPDDDPPRGTLQPQPPGRKPLERSLVGKVGWDIPAGVKHTDYVDVRLAIEVDDEEGESAEWPRSEIRDPRLVGEVRRPCRWERGEMVTRHCNSVDELLGEVHSALGRVVGHGVTKVPVGSGAKPYRFTQRRRRVGVRRSGGC